jgi:hypothetical protein
VLRRLPGHCTAARRTANSARCAGVSPMPAIPPEQTYIASSRTNSIVHQPLLPDPASQRLACAKAAVPTRTATPVSVAPIR